MITVLFFNPLTRESRTFGPYPAFRITGHAMIALPSETTLASHERGLWSIRGEKFINVSLQSDIAITCETAGEPVSDRMGPFNRMAIVDGALRAGAEGAELVAKLDEDERRWYLFAQKVYCDAITFSSWNPEPGEEQVG